MIGVASGTTSADALRGAGASHVIPDLTDSQRLLSLIGQVSAAR